MSDVDATADESDLSSDGPRQLCLSCGERPPRTAEVCPTCDSSLHIDGRYQIIGELGRGGSSHTYEAVRIADGEVFALKILSVQHIDDWKMLEHFRRQLEILGALDHDGIASGVEHFSAEIDGGAHECLVQALVPGRSLRHVLETGARRYDEASARAFLDEMLGILDYLHGFSPPIIHRDIKPANIVIRPDGRPVLVDFDTARGEAIDHSAADGTMVGTAGYVPAEQLAGRAAPASDLYGLGMTLVAMLTLRDPTSLPVERMRVQFEGFVNVSEGFERVIRGLTEPDVDERFQSTEEVRQALDRDSRASSERVVAARASATRPKPASAAKRAGSLPDEPLASESESGGSSGLTGFIFAIVAVGAIGGLVAMCSMSSSAPEHSLDDVPVERTLDDSEITSDGFGPFDVVWASSVHGSSSHYGDSQSWSAAQMVRAPNVWPNAKDSGSAWAPSGQNAGIEFATLGFEPTKTRRIVIVETYHPGAVMRVDDVSGEEHVALWRGRAPAPGGTAILNVDLAEPREISRLRVVLDTSRVDGWNEIDAVGLVRYDPDAPDGLARKSDVTAPRGAADDPLPQARTDAAPAAETTSHTDTDRAGETEMLAAGALPAEIDEIDWATRVIDVSSAYGDGDGWQGESALGGPEVFPAHTDSKKAWATKLENLGPEHIEVAFAQPVEAAEVVVVETLNPGTVARIIDTSADDGEHILWEGRMNRSAGARVARLILAEPRTIAQLRVELDTRRARGWNEIDAIGLVPVKTGK